MAYDDNWLEVFHNLQKARRKKGEADTGLEQGGGGCLYFGIDIIGCGSVGPVLRVRDVGDYIAHWEDVGQIPP